MSNLVTYSGTFKVVDADMAAMHSFTGLCDQWNVQREMESIPGGLLISLGGEDTIEVEELGQCMEPLAPFIFEYSKLTIYCPRNNTLRVLRYGNMETASAEIAAEILQPLEKLPLSVLQAAMTLLQTKINHRGR